MSIVHLLFASLSYFALLVPPTYGQNIERTAIDEMLNSMLKAGPTYREIMDASVFSYFDLPYDTELQQKVFAKTEEYKILSDSLAQIKSERKGEWQFQELYLLSDYLVDDSCFVIKTYENSGPSESPPKTNYGIYFPQLTYVTWPSEMFDIDGIYRTNMALMCADSTALAIEIDKKSLDIFLFYKIAGIKKLSYDFYKIDMANVREGNYGWKHNSEDVLVSKDAHLIVVSKDRRTIYFAKAYGNKL